MSSRAKQVLGIEFSAMLKTAILKFLIPEMNRFYLIRLVTVALTTIAVFRFILIPFWISGYSMVPTYRDGGFNFCFTLRYAFEAPRPSDVVLIRMAGDRVMLLKRVVATEGQTVSFVDGQLHVDGQPVVEPYLNGGDFQWNLPPRRVKEGHVYVIGDNRDVPMAYHCFGQTSLDRVAGVPLW